MEVLKGSGIPIMSVSLKFDVPEGVFSSIRKSPDEFIDELRLAAAVKWYEMEEISQEKAAEIAGISRADFIFSLNRFKVSPFQYSADEIIESLRNAD